MERFSWECRTKVCFGEGCVKEQLEPLIRGIAPEGSIMIGYGGGSVKKNGAYDDVMSVLETMGYSTDRAEDRRIIEFGGIMSNPTLAKMREGAALARDNNVGLIIAIGGGSVMDCCKAVSVQARYEEDAWEDFWMKGRPMTHDIVPCGCVVTMPATGSEVNGCAVLTNEETRIKCDRDYPQMNPVFALMDPRYTLTMPVRQLRAGTFDILSHIMETYFSLPLYGNPAEIIKTGKSKDFQAHNMEHQLSAYTDCNHGEGLAVLHPVYYRHIYKDGLPKFAAWARNVWGITDAEALRSESFAEEGMSDEELLAIAGIEELSELIREAGLPSSLRELGFGEEEKKLPPD